MHPTHSLVNGSFAAAVASLADRYAERRFAAKAAADKSAVVDTLASGVDALAGAAAKAPSWLSALGDTVAKDPVARNALLGTAVGGTLGAGTHLAKPRDKRDRRGLWRSLTAGALAGGAIGGGVGLTQRGLGGSGGGDVGVFKDPATGKKMRVDPKILAGNPAALRELQELSDPGTLLEQGVYGGLMSAGGFMYNNLPVSSVALPALALRDAYNNTRWVPRAVGRMADLAGQGGDALKARIGTGLGLDRVRDYAGTANRGGVFDMMQDADRQGLHRRVDAGSLRRGLEATHADASSPYTREAPLLKKVLQHSESETIMRAAQGDRAAMQRLEAIKLPTPPGYKGPARSLKDKFFRDVGGETRLTGKVRELADPKALEAAKKLGEKIDALRKAKATGVSAKELKAIADEVTTLRGQLRAHNVRVDAHGALLDDAARRGLEQAKTTATPAGGSSYYRRNFWTGKMEIKPGNPWTGGQRTLARLAVMGAIPLAEYSGRTMLGQMERERTLRERLNALAKPAN